MVKIWGGPPKKDPPRAKSGGVRKKFIFRNMSGTHIQEKSRNLKAVTRTVKKLRPKNLRGGCPTPPPAKKGLSG